MYQVYPYSYDHGLLRIDHEALSSIADARVLTRETSTAVSSHDTRRKIAYLRVVLDGMCCEEVWFTQFGRDKGVRNYQTLRPGDWPVPRITGAPPSDEPYFFHQHRTVYLIQGEGDPFATVTPWPTKILATATKLAKFAGWRVTEYQTNTTTIQGIGMDRGAITSWLKEHHCGQA